MIILHFIILLFALSCASSSRGKTASDEETFLEPIPLPAVRFVVASDLHYYSRTLGEGGPAFEHDMRNDRRLLAPRIARAYLMHIEGYEPGPDMEAIKEGATIGGRWALSIMGKTIAGWQTDIPPSDNDCILDLTSGYELSGSKRGAQ